MITEIGIVAGEILEFLESVKRPVGMDELKFYLDEPVEIIYMSLGWLIRDQFIYAINGAETRYALIKKSEFKEEERVECVPCWL